MNRNIKRLILAVISILAASVLGANACTGSFHLLVGNDMGTTVTSINVCDDFGNCLFSGASLGSDQAIEGDFTIISGQHYTFTAHTDGIDYHLDFYPTLQQGEIDILNPAYYSEWGGAICTPPLPTVSVSATLANAWESPEDPGVFTITRVSDGNSSPLTVNVQISGTATPGTDYPAISSQVTIPAGANSTTVYVWPFSDSISEPTETVVMTLIAGIYNVGSPASATVSIHDGGAPALANPSIPGTNSFIHQVVYASTGEMGDPPFTTPTVNYSINRRLNLTPFVNPSPNNSNAVISVPINGFLDVPNGSGSFPLAIFVHGSGFDAQGCLYLCDLLASDGILAASQEPTSAGPDTDGIQVLELIRQFAIWNATPGHPLYGKVDLNHIMLVGHSAGGEAVVTASYLNSITTYTNPYSGITVPLDGSAGFGPYAFNLKGIVNLAPQVDEWPDGLDEIRGIAIKENYLILHGSRDNDVTPFRGHETYDRAQPIDLSHPLNDASGFKALAWIIGANHNYFSSEAKGDESLGKVLFTQSQQELIAKVYIGAMANVVLLEQRQYLKFLKNFNVGISWLPTGNNGDNSFYNYTSQFQSPSRLFIDHYEEDTNLITLSPPLTGLGLNSWNVANPADLTELYFGASVYADLVEATHGVRFKSSNTSNYYEVSFSGAGLNASGYGHLAFRAGQSSYSIPAGYIQYLSIVVKDTTGHSASFRSLPLTCVDLGAYFQQSVMQTTRIPLNALRSAGVDVTHIALIKLTPTTTGTIYFDEIQLSN